MAETDSYQERKLKKYFLKILEEKLAFIIAVPLIAIFLTLFVFHFYRVDGISMENTFQDNDLLLVEKLGKTGSTLFRHSYAPKRYDIIVFKEPRYSTDEELVKRVIGLPGDTVEIRQNQVVVYNAQNPNGIEVDSHMPAHTRIIKTDYRYLGKYKVHVSPGQVFVLGDDRPNSDDSRVYGPIESKNIVGKVIIRIAPFKRFLIL